MPSSANYWRALNRQLCNKEQPGGDEPIEGGQCPVKYNVDVTRQESNSFACALQTNTRRRTVFGPISDISLFKVPPIQATNQTWRIELTCYGQGTVPTASPVKVLVAEFLNVGTNCPDPKITDVQIARVDGLPDDCPGYVPGPPPPPGWNKPVVNNFTWITNNGDVINEGDLNLELGFAYINADFDIEIPVKIDVGGINFNANFNFDKGAFNIDFSRDITNNFGDRIVRRPDGDDRELPDSDDDAPDSDDDIEEDPDVIEDDESLDGDDEGESRIIAARVVVTSVNNKSIGELVQGRNPNIGIPNYGFVQFFIPTDGDEGGWTQDIAVKNKNMFIPCPWLDGATRVRGTPRPGVSWTIGVLRSKDSNKVTYPA